MSDNNNSIAPSSSPSTTKSSSTDMPPPASNKRKRSTVAAANEVPIRISAAPPANVALPPPLMPYHPHLVPSYYPVYHQHPYFLSVGPQPPISPSLSPTLSSSASSTTTSTTTTTQRILPKSPATTANNSTAPTPTPPAAALAPAFNYFPYPIQVSPQLHPSSNSPMAQPQHPGSISPVPFHPIGAAAIRQNSVTSLGGALTTADQREQARKVSHSAIERRRRERINDKIIQLKDLIPSCADRENLHKMTILQSAIDYITYLKKVIEDLDTTGIVREQKANSIAVQQQTKSMLPKEVEPFTHQFSVQPINTTTTKEDDEEEDSWSVSSPTSPTTKANIASPVTPLPTSSLKPMDLIKLNKKTVSSPPPKIVVNENTTREKSPTQTSMNLENILC